MSSLSFEECAHKMLQMTIKPGQEVGGAIAVVFNSGLFTQQLKGLSSKIII